MALPPLGECAGAALLPAHYRGHEELDVPLLEASDDIGREEGSVQVEALDPDSLVADETEDLLEDLQPAICAPDEREGDGDPPSREDGVGGRIRVEPCGSTLGLSSDDFVLAPSRLSVVRDEGVVDGYLERASWEQTGCLLREQPVRPLEKRPQREVTEAVAHRALARSALVLLAYPAGGGFSGCCQREHAGDVLGRVLAVESLAQESEDPEHGYLDDLLGRDPSPGVIEAMVICPASACSFGAPPGSAIPSLAHVCTNTGTGGMAPNRF